MDFNKVINKEEITKAEKHIKNSKQSVFNEKTLNLIFLYKNKNIFEKKDIINLSMFDLMILESINENSNYNYIDDLLKEQFNIKDSSLTNIININDIEEKTIYLLVYLKKSNNNDELSSIIEGFLMYLSHEYQISLLSFFASVFYDYLSESIRYQICEFLNINQDENGSFGFVNPLKKTNVTSKDLREWKLINTVFSLIFIKRVHREYGVEK